jgi:transposase
MKHMNRRTFSPEQKAKIVLELLKESKTIAELAAEYEIHPNQLQRWKSEATDKMHLIFTKDSDEVEKMQKKHESEIDDLTKQIGQLTIEVNWLKKKIWHQIRPIQNGRPWLTGITKSVSIKGFSPLTAIALMSDVVDVKRFPSVKKFCAYLRTAPKVKSSNDKTVIGSTRHSRSLTCTLMSQSITHFAVAGEHLRSFYSRVKKGKKAGVYRMALILLVCFNRLWFFYGEDCNSRLKKVKAKRSSLRSALTFFILLIGWRL